MSEKNMNLNLAINPLPETDLKCDVNFQTREQASEFAKQWTRKTLMGHVISKATVTVTNVTKDSLAWINEYAENINYLASKSNKDLLSELGL